MNISNQINSVIDKIADKIGIAANQIGEYIKQLYILYIKQAYITGIQDIIWIIISILMIIFASKIFIKSLKSPKEVSNKNTYSEFPNIANSDIAKRIVCPILILIFAITIVVSINSSIVCFVNPEYWAYQHLVTDLGSLMK